LEGNQSYITFTNNTCSGYYGVISAEAGSVTFKNNKAAINFNENTACDWKGAAIYSASGVNFEGNEGIYFFKNASKSTNGLGGAIYNESGLVSFSNNEDVNFAYNQATFTGGAIYANGKDDEGVSVSMKGNACVTFDHNEALEEDKRWGIGGGAIYAVGSVSLSDNKRMDGTDGKSGVFFTYNTANTEGGAIYSDSKVSLTGNGAIKFDTNTATIGAGGAIRGVREITITDNAGNIEFKGNTAGTTGGAIHNKSTLDYYKQQWVRINRNTGDISFTGNKAGTNGGVIDMGHRGGLELLDNTGSITFSDNTAVGIGGAIYTSCGEGVLIENNTGDVTFRNNRAGSKAGAIYSGAYPNEIGLSIRNNGNVLFEKNAVVDDSGNYILRSYQHNDDFLGAMYSFPQQPVKPLSSEILLPVHLNFT
jgi:predicted outer membrane repeat protein